MIGGTIRAGPYGTVDFTRLIPDKHMKHGKACV